MNRPFILGHHWEPFVENQAANDQVAEPAAEDWLARENAEALSWALLCGTGILCFGAGALVTAGIALVWSWFL